MVVICIRNKKCLDTLTGKNIPHHVATKLTAIMANLNPQLEANQLILYNLKLLIIIPISLTIVFPMQVSWQFLIILLIIITYIIIKNYISIRVAFVSDDDADGIGSSYLCKWFPIIRDCNVDFFTKDNFDINDAIFKKYSLIGFFDTNPTKAYVQQVPPKNPTIVFNEHGQRPEYLQDFMNRDSVLYIEPEIPGNGSTIILVATLLQSYGILTPQMRKIVTMVTHLDDNQYLSTMNLTEEFHSYIDDANQISAALKERPTLIRKLFSSTVRTYNNIIQHMKSRSIILLKIQQDAYKEIAEKQIDLNNLNDLNIFEDDVAQNWIIIKTTDAKNISLQPSFKMHLCIIEQIKTYLNETECILNNKYIKIGFLYLYKKEGTLICSMKRVVFENTKSKWIICRDQSITKWLNCVRVLRSANFDKFLKIIESKFCISRNDDYGGGENSGGWHWVIPQNLDINNVVNELQDQIKLHPIGCFI